MYARGSTTISPRQYRHPTHPTHKTSYTSTESRHKTYFNRAILAFYAQKSIEKHQKLCKNLGKWNKMRLFAVRKHIARERKLTV